MIASTLVPSAPAANEAQRSARFEPSDPSTPTTTRPRSAVGCSIVIEWRSLSLDSEPRIGPRSCYFHDNTPITNRGLRPIHSTRPEEVGPVHWLSLIHISEPTRRT